MDKVLPGYVWVVRLARYRNIATGRFVSQRQVLSLLDNVVDELEESMVRGTLSVLEGSLNSNVWMVRTKDVLKRYYLSTASLEAGGWDRLTQSDFGRIGQRLRQEYAALKGLMEGILDGEVSEAQALNRLHMYAGGARATALEIGQLHLPPPPRGKVRLFRRILGRAEHCDSCVDYYHMGWQPQGVLPVPGVGSVCLTNCRCHMKVKIVPEADESKYVGSASKDGPKMWPRWQARKAKMAAAKEQRKQARASRAAARKIEKEQRRVARLLKGQA